MADYSYKARSQEGELMSGVVVAPTENVAYGILRDKNLFIVDLKEQKKMKLFANGLSFGKPVKTKEVVIFARQLSVMITSNVPIVRALKVLVKQTENNKFKTIISDVADEVDGGAKLSQSLGRYPKVFSNFFIQMVRSAETTGRLDEILEYLADQSEKDYDMVAKARGALIYPAFILSALVVVAFLMMIFVLPQIMSIFAGTNIPLPITTRIFMGASNFTIKYWWLFIVVAIGLVVGYRIVSQTEKGQERIDLLKLRLPLVGPIFGRTYISRFSRSLSTLLASGVTLTQSLDIVSDVVGNKIYYNLIQETIKQVEAGASITSIFVKSKDVPLILSQMMSVGEQSGQLDKILSKVADFYTRELENSLKNLTTLIEPIIMVIMGVAVGLLVSAIILPIYNMSNAI